MTCRKGNKFNAHEVEDGDAVEDRFYVIILIDLALADSQPNYSDFYEIIYNNSNARTMPIL